MESIENIIDAIGIEGKQAIRPKVSVKHLDEKRSSQGSVKIPLTIKYRRIMI